MENYHQVLDIISDANKTLPGLFEDFGITNKATLEEWLVEEKGYLQSLSHEPLEETLKMEYLDQLMKLMGSQ